MMMFTSGHRIVMAHILHFDKNLGGKKYSFLVMMQSEKKLDEAIKKAEFLCPVLIRGLISAVKEDTTILEEALESYRISSS